MIYPATALGNYCLRRVGATGLLVGLTLLAGCGPADIPTGTNDPYEAANRRVHDWNKQFNRNVFGAGGGDGAAAARTGSDSFDLPEDGEAAVQDLSEVAPDAYSAPPPQPASPALIALANFGTNLDNPRRVLNSLLQLRPGDAAHNTLRFGINSTIGIGGLIDVAGAAGLPEIDTNFSETMHVWGVPEGAYQELPVVGPSTQRDTVGSFVDFAINPLWYALGWPGNLVANGFVWAGEATDRIRYAETVDSIYFDSEDSYSQARIIYLQNRRFELRRGDLAEEDYVDPYEELYGD